MAIFSAIKNVKEFFSVEESKMYDGSLLEIPLGKDRVYVIPGYQREIRWSSENVQILIDDLAEGSKFLGTIILSTLDRNKYDIIDGQQRITVITLLITYLDLFINERRKIGELCKIENSSFPCFSDALSYGFNYDEISSDNKPLYDEILRSDMLGQKDDFQTIWNAIKERIDIMPTSKQEDLYRRIGDSKLNIVVNSLDGSDDQRKFCIDYFIDINNKSVQLDSVDIIRAYAFKQDFEYMTSLWIDIQDKCNKLAHEVKLSRKELYMHYFVCMVNKEVNYSLKKPLSEIYAIKEDVEIDKKEYATGTFIWNIFSNESFYSELLEDLNSYLDFIQIVIRHENGGNDEFKKYFQISDEKQCSGTRIHNCHSIINAILRNDDSVPKMMVLKYYLEVLKPTTSAEKAYKSIYDINAIATLFTTMVNKKESEQIASKILQKDWITAIKEYAYKKLKEFHETIDYSKVARLNKKYTVESGQYIARRYYALHEAYKWDDGNVSSNEKIFHEATISNGPNNMEHFIINRDYKYALYLDDGKTVDITISIPGKYKKYIATIANYLILDADTNTKLKNRTVYDKIELLEAEIHEKGIDRIIPNRRSQLHYLLIKDIMHDKSKYPKQQIIETAKKAERKRILKAYYTDHFAEEFDTLVQALKNEDRLYCLGMEYRLSLIGFEKQNETMKYLGDTEFANVEVSIETRRKVFISAERYNPFFGDESDNYDKLIKTIEDDMKKSMGKKPCLSSSNEYGGSDDESITFSYNLQIDYPEVEPVKNFIAILTPVSS